MEHNDETFPKHSSPSDLSSLQELDTLSRYIRGELPPHEREQVENALRNSLSLRAVAQVLTQSRVRPPDLGTQISMERRLERFRHTIGHADAAFNLPYTPSTPLQGGERVVLESGISYSRLPWSPQDAGLSVRRWRWGAAAMTVVAVIGVTTLLLTQRHRTPTAVPVQQYVTAIGERASFTLPDGSQVMLGPSSQLDVAPDFGNGNVKRGVSLKGVAYFSIVPTESSPFIVKAGNAQVRVLGTDFSVRHYQGDSAVTVAVESGRVAVALAETSGPMPLVASANDVAFVLQTRTNVLTSVRTSVRSSSADVARLTSWTRGRIEFEDTPLREALPELKRWYNVAFQLADTSIQQVRLTGGFSSHRVEDLEETLRYVLPVTVRRSGRTILLAPR